MKTLYITDLDGTFLNECKEVSRITADYLNMLIKKGVNFSVASARTSASALRILSPLDINQPIILMNGAVIYDIDKNTYIKKEIIEPKAVGEILETFTALKVTGFMYVIAEDCLETYYEDLESQIMQEFRNERIKKYYKRFMEVESLAETAAKSDVIYFTLIDKYDCLAVVCKELQNIKGINAVLYRDIYAEDIWFLEIYSNTASKRNAVEFLRQSQGFDKIIGFGDNYNDIPLFQACDEAYAVDNAVEELKEMARGILGNNCSDAVAKFIWEREK